MPKEGESYVEVRGDTSKFVDDVERGIRKGSEEVEDDLQGTGKQWGDTISDSLGDEVEKKAPEIAKKLERGLAKQKTVTKVRWELDKDNNVIRKFVTRTTSEIEDAFSDAARPGGPFSRVGSVITDAIGAGFNVSGRSPLIMLLIPVIGAIAALVAAALQAIGALIPLLAGIPALLAAIGLEVGVTVIAFQGMGEAIQGAFAAKNAKELNEAIKDLTPSAQEFVKSLLPLKGIFESLQNLIQEAFFANLGPVGNDFASFLVSITPSLVAIAEAMGTLFRRLVAFFTGPQFLQFLQLLTPSTIHFIDLFGRGLVTFLEGLTALSVALLPFLNTFGQQIFEILTNVGGFFKELSTDPEFRRWLEEMAFTLILVFDLLRSVIGFIGSFLDSLDKAGGKRILEELTQMFDILAAFFQSEFGQKAMEGLVHTIEIFLFSFFGLLLAVLAIFGVIEYIFESLRAFWKWLTETAIPAIGRFFSDLGGHVGGFFSDLGGWITTATTGLLAMVSTWTTTVLGFFGGLGQRAFDAGRNVIRALADGVTSMINYLANAVRNAIYLGLTRFLPGSPADAGPLSGEGSTLQRGQRMMEDFAKGITMGGDTISKAMTEAVNNVNFGPGAVVVNYQGPLPEEGQMRRFGRAAGSGITDILAARDTRLAIRTL